MCVCVTCSFINLLSGYLVHSSLCKTKRPLQHKAVLNFLPVFSTVRELRLLLERCGAAFKQRKTLFFPKEHGKGNKKSSEEY